MKTIAAAVLAFVLLSWGTVARTDQAPGLAREARAAQAHYERGTGSLQTEPAQKSNARRLAVLDSALYHLRKARDATQRAGSAAPFELRVFIDRGLVRALNRETEIYIERRSLALARARNLESQRIDALDSETRQLSRMILDAEYDSANPPYGSEADRRLRARRRPFGVPLRDRGFSADRRPQ